MKKEVLIILGSPNSPKGELTTISKQRLNYCKKIFKEDMMVLCTGGNGAHFNIAEKAHAYYTKNYLIKKGISDTFFLDFALSQNTVEDAVKSKEILLKTDNISSLRIITSDYHLERVKLIFNEILSDYKMKFVGLKSNLTKEEHTALINHEHKAIEGIIKNGLYY
ncbi:YdcF family protein [Polaribacter ponticola]|uniref:YdcF family protein n=1 Tax=Polaribacter ponticola TaxID=2978475 RepID=A0ABT5S6V8_9FLAO|nr:YdcF family protein [Polaribacter sp. MSW5]MDD7913579.1 YdcF family protein [Polaribacter sp. MSW5]